MTQKPPKTKVPLSKNTAAYWQRKVFREEKFDTPSKAGSPSEKVERKAVWVSPNYYVRMQVGEERRKIRLRATVAEEAGKEAAKLYREIIGNGWPKKKGSIEADPDVLPTNTTITIGTWIKAAVAKAEVRPATANKYAESLRTIVGDLLGHSKSRKAEVRMKIDDFPLEKLNQENLRAWIDKRIALAGRDVVKLKRAKNTIRALMANSKGLFTATVQERMGIDEGSIVEPFRGVKLPARSNARYSSQFDAKLLLEAASRELGGCGKDDVDPGKFEQRKILYLALVAGLRYREIDNLRVRDVSPQGRRISIRSHGEYQPKTLSSEADVTVSEQAGIVLTEMLKKTKGGWFISESKSSRSSQYRTGAHHDALLDWLRNYEEGGIKPLAESHKPLHELRKEAGTLVNSQFGLNEAKTFLRHSSITTTAAYYLGSKGEITTGLG